MKPKTIAQLVSLIAFFIIISLVYLLQPVSTSQVVKVPAGSSSLIVRTFMKQGYNLNEWDKYILYFIGQPQKGYIDLGFRETTKINFLYSLTKAKGALVGLPAIPGNSTYLFLSDIATKMTLDHNLLYELYLKQAPYIDGVILAETYTFNRNMDEQEVIDFLISYSQKEHKKLANQYLNHYDQQEWFRYITIASLIQKESASQSEMPLVSSVIYNRLKAKMLLQMDSSINYAKNSKTKMTSKRLKQDNSPFNTYKNKGLPPSPIAIVGLDAIEAAIYPAVSDYLYFVKKPHSKEHIFSTNYREHIKHIGSLKRR